MGFNDSEMEAKKQAIIKVYPKAKYWIDAKSDAQIIAIYLRLKNQGNLR